MVIDVLKQLLLEQELAFISSSRLVQERRNKQNAPQTYLQASNQNKPLAIKIPTVIVNQRARNQLFRHLVCVWLCAFVESRTRTRTSTVFRVPPAPCNALLMNIWRSKKQYPPAQFVVSSWVPHLNPPIVSVCRAHAFVMLLHMRAIYSIHSFLEAKGKKPNLSFHKTSKCLVAL